MREIRFEVFDLPPAKNEAKSMLAEGHSHAGRVSSLLMAAAEALHTSAWATSTDASLGLEMVLTCPTPPPSDATNYLGGVGDVLEGKSRRGELRHLGGLAGVALFSNDRVLHEVSYRWEAGAPISYQLRLWER